MQREPKQEARARRLSRVEWVAVASVAAALLMTVVLTLGGDEQAPAADAASAEESAPGADGGAAAAGRGTPGSLRTGALRPAMPPRIAGSGGGAKPPEQAAAAREEPPPEPAATATARPAADVPSGKPDPLMLALAAMVASNSGQPCSAPGSTDRGSPPPCVLLLFSEQRPGAPAASAPWLPFVSGAPPDEALAEKGAGSALRKAGFGTSEGHPVAVREGSGLGRINGTLTAGQAQLLKRDTGATLILVGQLTVSGLHGEPGGKHDDCSVYGSGTAYTPDGAYLTTGEAQVRLPYASTTAACDGDALVKGGAALAFDLLERVAVQRLPGTMAPQFSGPSASASGRERISLWQLLHKPPVAPLVLTFVTQGGSVCPDSLTRLVSLSRRTGAKLLPILSGGFLAGGVPAACGLPRSDLLNDETGNVSGLFGTRISEPLAPAKPGWYRIPDSPGLEATLVLDHEGRVFSAHLERGEALERAVERALTNLAAGAPHAGR